MNNYQKYSIFVMFRVRISDLDIAKRLLRFDDTIDSCPNNNEDGFVVTLDILEKKNYSWIKDLLDKDVICRQESDIFISLRSNLDSGIIDFPEWIRFLINLLDVKVTLSYTIL